MSGAIAASLLPFGAVGRLGAAALAINNRDEALQAQASSGLLAPNVADLGAATEQVLDLQPQLAAVDAWNANVTVATNRLAVAQSAIGGIGDLASSIETTLVGLSDADGSSRAAAVAAAASEATASLQQLGALLNTQDGDSFVFGGNDNTTAPVAAGASLASGALNTAIAQAVAALPASGSGATIASILSAATGTAAGQPFSAAISGPSPGNGSVVVGVGESVDSSVAATTGTLAAPTATSTGSPVRDLVAVLAAVASLSSSSAGSADFESFISALQTTASGAVSGLSDLAGGMGATQDFLTNTANTYASVSDALTSRIGSLTSVDLAAVSTEASEASASLQASYELIADLKGLSLANYL